MKATDANVLRAFTPRPHLATVEGVPAFLGTCTGFGSTVSAALGGVCAYCGVIDGHRATCTPTTPGRSPPPWSDEDDGVLLSGMLEMTSSHHEGNNGSADLVAFVESVAGQLNREAADVLARIHRIGQ